MNKPKCVTTADFVPFRIPKIDFTQNLSERIIMKFPCCGKRPAR